MAAPIPLFIGDTWSFPCELRDPDGNPIDLTGQSPGGEYWTAFAALPQADLTLANGRVTAFVPGKGTFVLRLEPAVTQLAVPCLPTAHSFPTRIQVFVIDGAGNRKTYGIIAIAPADPRSA